MQFDEVEKAMIQVVECYFKIIFCFLTNRKCDFFQVDRATIQLVEWHLKFIFCHLTNPKFDFFSCCKALRSHFLPLHQPKMRFG